MRRRGPMVLAILGLGLLGPGRPVMAAERVSVAVGGFGTIAFLPYEVAQARGFFREQGLEIDSRYLPSGSHAATAALAGSADFAAASLDHALKASVQGKSLTMIAAFSEVPGMQLLVRSDYRGAVRDLRDLKGRPIGVTGLGASTHMVLTYVLTRGGLRPEEINAIPVGGQAMAAALENGRVDGLMTGGLPTAKLLRAGRAFVLLDLTARGPAEAFFSGPYQETGVLTRAEVVAKRPDLCRKVVLAIVRANQWIATHTAAEIAALLPETIVQDRALYVTALEAVRDGFSKDGRINPRAVETVINAHRAFGAIPAGRRVNPAGLYDNTFVDQALAGSS